MVQWHFSTLAGLDASATLVHTFCDPQNILCFCFEFSIRFRNVFYKEIEDEKYKFFLICSHAYCFGCDLHLCLNSDFLSIMLPYITLHMPGNHSITPSTLSRKNFVSCMHCRWTFICLFFYWFTVLWLAKILNLL